jgi:hypothetical protein
LRLLDIVDMLDAELNCLSGIDDAMEGREQVESCNLEGIRALLDAHRGRLSEVRDELDMLVERE